MGAARSQTRANFFIKKSWIKTLRSGCAQEWRAYASYLSTHRQLGHPWPQTRRWVIHSPINTSARSPGLPDTAMEDRMAVACLRMFGPFEVAGALWASKGLLLLGAGAHSIPHLINIYCHCR